MDLTIRGARARVVLVPLNIPLGTSVTVIREVPLILLDLETEEGVPGRAYIFAYTRSGATAVVAHLHEAAALVRGMAAAPQAIHDLLVRRFALLGVTGTVRMALSLLDLALWDATGRAVGLPIAQLLGGTCRAIPAYDSRGLGPKDAEALADQAAELAASGCAAVKLRLGYPDLAGDLHALEAVQARLPPEIGLMVDYNQALSVAEALHRGRALEGRGLLWLEEPVRHDDLRGQAAIAAALHLPLQTGENFNGPEALADALAAAACDFVMPDVARIGGVTGFMRAAAVAGAQGVAVSSHLMPELSVHLLAASQTAHWVEWVDWADAVLVEPLRPANGSLTPAVRPGFGLDWDEDRVARLEQA